MSDTWLNFIICICTMAIGFLAFVNEIQKAGIWYKSVRFKIIVFIIGSIFIFLATHWKDKNTELRIKSEQDLAIKKQNNRDSLNTRNVFESVNKALYQFGLIVDSTTEGITITSKQVTNNIFGSDPCLSLDAKLTIKHIDGEPQDFFKINLACYYAAAKNISLTIYCLIERNGYVKYISQIEPMPVNFEMVSDQTIHIPYLSTIKVNPATTRYYFLIKGKYTNSDLSKTFPLDVLYGFDILNNIVGIVAEPENSDVRKFLAKNKVGYLL